MQLHAATTDFDAVYRAHHGFVWRTLRHLGVDPGRIDDALQDTFLVVHRRLAEFEGRAALRTWLFEIARRTAARYRRTAARDAPRSCEVPDLQSPAHLDDELAKAEAAEILGVFLDELDRDKSVVFIMAELEQRRAPEIAEALDLNLNTVYARLRAARQQLDRLIIRLQAREHRHVHRAAQVVAAALLLEIPSASARTWPALAPAATTSLLSHTTILTTLGLGALVVTLAVQPPRDPPPPPPIVTTTAPVTISTPQPVPSAIPTPPPTIPPPPRPRPIPTDLERELALIEPARAALLADDPRAALRLLTRHQQQFASGIFAQEAAAARIEALCQLGDRTRAATETTIFHTRWPDSNLHTWLHTVCTDN